MFIQAHTTPRKAEPMQITLEQAVRTAEAVVAEYGPNHTDATDFPRYFDQAGKGSCLVGVMLAKWGITREKVSFMNASSIGSVIAERIIDVDNRTYDFLCVLQQSNDHHRPWGEALDRAMAHVGWEDPALRARLLKRAKELRDALVKRGIKVDETKADEAPEKEVTEVTIPASWMQMQPIKWEDNSVMFTMPEPIKWSFEPQTFVVDTEKVEKELTSV
jgi:hypothetical protein